MTRPWPPPREHVIAVAREIAYGPRDQTSSARTADREARNVAAVLLLDVAEGMPCKARRALARGDRWIAAGCALNGLGLLVDGLATAWARPGWLSACLALLLIWSSAAPFAIAGRVLRRARRELEAMAPGSS